MKYSNQEMKMTVPPGELFTLYDAQKILGEAAHFKDSSSTVKKGLSVFQSSFESDAFDSVSQKTGVIYFLIEIYPDEKSAHKGHEFIYKANAKNEGVEVLKDFGDEAYFHTDKENFYYIQVRNKNKVFRIKVNKITSSTSLDEFYNVARHINHILTE